MTHSRHFIPGCSTLLAFFGAFSASEAAAWGGALTAFMATLAGIIWDTLRKREQLRVERHKNERESRREKGRAEREKMWADWCLKRRMKAMDEGKPDPFPGGLPPLEHDDDEHEGHERASESTPATAG